MKAGEWRSAAYANYVDEDTLDAEVFLNAILEDSDKEDEDDPQ